MAIIYLSNENFTCPKEQKIIMHKEPSLSHTLFITIHILFKNSMKPDINTIENSVYPDQLLQKPADQDPHCFQYDMRL